MKKVFETSNKLKTIWLKELYTYISRIGGLNWPKVLKRN